MSYPVNKPPKLIFKNDAGRKTPLSSLEIDGNFVLLDYNINQKLDKSDFSQENIIGLLNEDSLSFSENGVNAGKLVGMRPSPNNNVDTIVSRDNLGNFSANEISANIFRGKSTKSVDSETTQKLKTPILINGVTFDGSYNITILDDTKIKKTGDTTSGKIIFSSNSTAPINIKSNTSTPTLIDGDIFYHNNTLKIRVGGVTKSLAFSDGNISGTSSNVSGVVEIVNGGTGANNATDVRKNIWAAKSGKNDDIIELGGLRVALSASMGGTGLKEVGENNNILVSNGVGWESKSISNVFGNSIDNAISTKLSTAISAQLNDPNNYSRTTDGFCNLVGGIKLKWGNFVISETSQTQNIFFDNKFTNEVFHVLITVTDTNEKSISVINKNKNSATISKSPNDKTMRTGSWVAIGY